MESATSCCISCWRLFAISNFGWKPLHHLLYPQVDLLNQLLVIPVGFQGLAECEQVFLTVVADQRLHDGFFAGTNARVPQLRQSMRIVFASQDRVHDGQTGCSIQIADDMVNLRRFI